MAQFAQNPSTGEWLVNLGGGWMPAEVAENPSTGERAYRMGGGAWEITPSAQPAPPADVAPPPMLTSQMDPNPVLRAILGVDAPTPGMPVDPLAADTRNLRGRNAGPPVRQPSMGMPPMGAEVPVDLSTAGGDFEAGQLMLGMVPGGLNVLSGANKSSLDTSMPQPGQNPLVGGPGLMPPDAAANVPGDDDFARMRAQMADEGTRQILDALPGIITRQAEIGTIPVNPAAQEVMNADGFMDAVSAAARGLGDDPYGLLRTFILRSLPASAPGIGGALVGSAAAGPGGAAAGAGIGEFLTEGGISAADGVTQALMEAGVDPTNRAAVEAFVQANPEAMRAVAMDALQRAGIISATGAVSGGVSGLAAQRIARGGRSGRQLAGDAAGALAIEPVMEGAGEALAGGSGADVVAEALGGAGQGAVQLGGQTIVEVIRQALSAPAQPQSAPPAPVAAPGAPDAPAAPVAAPAVAPAPVRPAAPQPGKEPSNLFSDYVTGRTLRLYSGRVQGEPVTVTGMTADGITIQRQNGETDSIPASDLRDGFATLIDERGEIVRPTDAPAPPAAKPAQKRAGPADLSGVSDDTIANVGNAIFDSGLSNPEGAARVLMLPKEAEELRAAGIEISDEGVVSQDDIRALVEERESRGARRRPASTEIEATSAPAIPPAIRQEPRIPSPEEEAEAQRIERAAAKLPSAQVTSWVATLPSDRRAASSAARPATGIDPDGEIGRELKANGVTPQRFPRLFQKGGRRDLDNIPYSQLPEGFDQILKADEAGYVDRQDLIDAIIAEANKTPRLTSEQSELRRQAETVARRYQPDYGATTLPDEPVSAFGRYVVSDPNTDLAPPAERAAEVSRVVDDLLANEYPGVRLDPRERMQIEDNLFYRGGDADDALNWWIIQEDQYVRAEDPEAYQPLPFDIGDAPVLSSEDPVLGRGSPDAAQSDAGADQPRAPGAGDTGRAEPGGERQGPDDARPGPGAARTGTAEGGRVDLTREGQQLVIPGAEQITDKQRAERKMEQPKRGGDAPPPDGGLFSPKGPELFDDRAGKSNRGFSLNDASEPTKSASSNRELEDGNYMEVFHWSPHDFEQLESGFEMTGEGGLDEGHGAYFTRWQISGLWYSSQNNRADNSFVYEVMVPADPHLLEWNVRRDKQRNKDLVGAVDSDLPVVKRSKPPRAEYDGINVKYQDGVGAYDAFPVTPQRSDFDANKAREDAAAESIEELGYYDSDDITGRVSEKAQAAIDGYVIEEGPLAGTSYKSVKEMEDAVTSLYANDPPRRIQKWQQDEEFRSFYKRIEGALGSPEAASKWMEERGVRGHAYQSYDYGSPHNLVIYNPEKHTKVTGRLRRSEFSQRSFDILQKMAERNLKSDAEYSLPGPADWNRGKPVRSEGFSLSDAAAPKKPKPKSTGRQPQGSLTPSFLSMSFTDKNSVYEAAFRAAGMEPDKARLLPAARQIAILSKLLEDTYGVKIELPQITMQRKTVSGRKVEEKRPQISDRDAIDQMLDAFRQMQMMAHILGLPVGAVGLREGGVTGKGLILSLTRRLKGALGMYSYEPEGGARKITLPGRSNSFGHEWGHALDHFVHALFKGDWSKMLSRDIFKTGVTPASKSNQIAQAFTGVLQAMYGERAALAALQIDLTLRAAQLNKKGEQTAAAKKAQGYLNMIEAGAKLPPDAWSGYFTTSAQFDEAFGGGGYFTDPAEMFARAFEAYLGTKAAAMSGLPTSFLSKPDWAYNDSDETRASLTFPRGTDQIRVFAAIDRLMDEIREHGVFGEGRADKPEDADVYQSRVWDKMQPEGSLVEQERAARRRAKRTATAIERTHPLWKQGRDFVSFMTDTFGGFLHGLINRQPPQAQAALRNMVDLFVTDPGSGRLIKPVWEAAVQIITTRHVNRLENMVAAHKLEEYTEAETAQLRQVLTGAKIKVDPKIEKAAADLRRMMDELWRYLTEAGVKIGYARNGYLPRIMDRDAVMVNQAGFKTQAAKVYATMFRRDVRTAEMEDQITDVRMLLRQINADTEGTETGDRVATARLDPSDIDLIDNWKKALTKLNRLEKQAADLAKKGDEDKADALSEKIGEAREAFEALHADMLDMLERQWSAYAADKWLVGVLAKSAMDIGGNAPASGFTKKRELPAEADKLMADFYQGNPVTLIHDFIGAAARRAEWTRRVGEGGEKLNNMVEAAIKAGADSRDVEEIRHSINVLAGRVSNNGESFVHTVYGWFYTFTTMFLLKLAPLASLAEPMVAGLKTGRMRDSIRGLGLLLSQARKTGSAQDRRELARVIGLTRSAMNETVLQNRYGGEMDPSQTQARLMSSFFQSIGLTGLTNASRHAMLPIGADHIRRMLMIDAGRRKGFFEVNAKAANEELNDLGVPKEHREALLDWLDSMDGRLPTVEDLIGVDGDYFNPAAAIWGPALLQFVDTAIQNTRKFDRPGAALRPGMGLIYGITGFIFSFHRNVLGRMLKQGVDARRPGEGRARAAVRQTAGAARNVARYAPAIGALVAGHTLASIFRDALFAPDGWEDAEEDDELTEWLLSRAWSRTGLMGAWDIPYNLITGLRYDRDLASAGVGPHIGVPLQAAQKFGNIWFGRNSENTNTTENRGLDAVASLVLTGFGNMAISAIPGGPLTTAGKGAAIHGWTYLDPGQLVADALFPMDE